MHRFMAFASSAVMSLAAACSSTSAPADGRPAEIPVDALVVYSGREEALIGDLVDEFTTDTGIEVAVKYGETSELAATLAEEGTGTPADVFWAQDAGALGAVEGEGLLAPIPTDVLNLVDARYRSEDGRWVATSARVRVIGYSTERVEESDVPTDVHGLTDGRWKGRVGWAPTNGSFHAFITAMRLQDGEDPTRQWLEAMIANDAVAYAKNSATVLGIDAGEVDLGLINHYYPLQIAQEQADLGVDSVFPEGVGGLANVAGVGVLAPSDASDAAEQFVRYLLEETSQRYFTERTFEYPVRDGVAADDRLPPLADLDLPDIELGALTDLEGTLDLLSDVGLL